MFYGKIDCDQIEHLEGEKYSQYTMERNPTTYMSMRDYRNLPWQQPVERNPNPCRSMRDYRDQWMSTPSYSVTPTYARLASPYYTHTSQQQQPPTSSPIEQAILNLSKLVDNFIKEQRALDVQANKEIDTVENSLDQTLDGLQSGIDHKFDNLQTSISKLAQQNVHQEEQKPEGSA